MGKGVALSAPGALVLPVDEGVHRGRVGDDRHGGYQRDQRVSAGLDDERTVGIGEGAQHKRCPLHARQLQGGRHRVIMALAGKVS
jgi:hypothetical protein